jgi:glycosyltransferase involved in cell wall biosynthesis
MAERSVLVLSTTPPLPREYGNRNRVHQTVSFFRQTGFAVSFLLYPIDREWADTVPEYYRQLVDSFDYFAVIPNSRKLHQNARGYHHAIDDWWDDNIAQYLIWLFQRKKFDILFVNYTFLAKAFEFAPSGVIKILDTHDLFSGRRELFEKFGVMPEFFYTSPEEERVALDRADAVVAIKPSEAVALKALTSRTVFSLPYWDDRQWDYGRLKDRADLCKPADYDTDRPLRLGFLGAHNSVNVVNLRRFLSIFSRYAVLYNLPVEVIVAGNVCVGIADDYPFVKKLGFLADAAEFYNMIDAVVIPLEFSTGIKIKAAEALAWQVPVLATRDAFDGFRAYHCTQEAPTIHALCEMIVSVAYGEIPPKELAWATRKAGLAAALAQERGFADLRAWIDKSLGPVVRACRQLLTCLSEPVQELGPDQLLERARALSRDDTFRPFADHCAHEICRALGYPTGSWGLSQKIFQRNFDLHGQIKWINKQVVADS